jgi:aspartate racemase
VLEILLKAAREIERAGADLLLLCANTAHKLADEIGRGIRIPIVHIVDVTALEIQKAGLRKVGLLGTRFTMEEDFFKGRLLEKHGIEALTPGKEDRERVHRIIIDELAMGSIRPASRGTVVRIMGELAAQGAQAIILGCTELPLLVTQDHSPIPLIDTTTLHARAAVESALASPL